MATVLDKSYEVQTCLEARVGKDSVNHILRMLYHIVVERVDSETRQGGFKYYLCFLEL